MTTVSVKEVIARIIRNNRNIDTSYIDNIYEWIAEGMFKLENTSKLTKAYYLLNVKQFCAAKPCDFVETIGLAKNGVRLPLSNDERSILNSPVGTAGNNIFQFDYLASGSIPTTEGAFRNPQDYSEVDALKSINMETINSLSYQENSNYYLFPFESGQVELTYYKRDTDEDGFPLVPDNENYKTALYWYVLTMLIGSGYDHPNKEFSHSYCFRLFEMYAGRAINELKMPTPEEMEMIKRSHIRLMPNTNAYEEFFSQSSRKERIVR